ncbi:deoxyribose-phosphate aldolase [Bacteroidales bacterium OttesenSCG-928-M06]|nr:deoxyribose-phosphate aldolase [Bacteroidales bacterium OttesenSCG-928-M06]
MMNKVEEVFSRYNLNLEDSTVSKRVQEITDKIDSKINPEELKLIYSCIDLTSLNSEDSKESIWNLVERVNNFEGSTDLNNVAAICVYPNFVQIVKEALAADVKIASVAGGFPSSQTFLEVKMAEVSLAVAEGAEEIDIVLNIGDFIDNNYLEITEEISEIKEACRGSKLKVILETGVLKSAVNIKKAAILSIYSGADFIKTSTGKNYLGATPEAAFIMCETIKEYYKLHNKKIGIKVSGGIKTVQDAILYYTIVKNVLGEKWLTPELFRIGASGLADNILKLL